MALSITLQKNFRLAMAPAVAVIALASARGIMGLIDARLEPSAASFAAGLNARPRAAAEHPFHATSGDAILAHNPFDSEWATRAKPPEEAPSDPMVAPSCDGIRIEGIISSDDPDWSFVAFAPRDAPADGAPGRGVLRRKGGEVGDMRVALVGWDRVWMEGAHGLCQVAMYGAPAAPPVARDQGKAPVASWVSQGIEVVSPTQRRVDRGIIPQLIEKRSELLGGAHVVPKLTNGKLEGLQVIGVKPGSALDQLGIAENDQLRTINGYDLTKPESALEAYAKLQTADHLVLSLNRGGKEVQLEFDVR